MRCGVGLCCALICVPSPWRFASHSTRANELESPSAYLAPRTAGCAALRKMGGGMRTVVVLSAFTLLLVLGSAEASASPCNFQTPGTTMRLLGNCTTDVSI